VAHIVRNSGGRISLTSHEGRGTRFELTWPIAERHPEVLAVTATNSVNSGCRILVAEDNEWVRRMFVVDAIMPGCSSARLVGEFSTRYPMAPILVCSGQLDPQVSTIVDSVKASFLPKPFTPTELAGIARSQLSATQSKGNARTAGALLSRLTRAYLLPTEDVID
jgi:DNA-binding NtrC family response regulator